MGGEIFLDRRRPSELDYFKRDAIRTNPTPPNILPLRARPPSAPSVATGGEQSRGLRV